ncbi:hypothetical protein Hanom_Chr06g00506541 [Helianthus anomalus]
MGLKEALRLKSFDSSEFDVQATRTPKGNPPYLNVVQENLYQIREPTAPTNQEAASGQGGSGSAPVAQALNVVPTQAAVVTSGDKGKNVSSSGTKGSGSKFVIEDEGVHLSIEDEGTRAEGGAEGDDGGDEERPRVSLKRRWAASSKSDPCLKLVKKKKIDFYTIALDDDEDERATGFSPAGGLLETLDAHLLGGRTPRDRPVNMPTNPLSFGGPTTKVIEYIHMPEPLSFKRIEPSPSGKPTTRVASNVSRPSPHPIDGGDSASSSPLWYKTEVVFLSWELGLGDVGDMDSARALEKYIPEWSLVNKDRIMDALSAKMALFHLGTPAEHAHYRKTSGLELGNALMLNQAQSNSLVVETYALVDRLKEQVSEAKEVNKSSQASAAAAYEARDKALQDLEALKLRFGDLEKKLSDADKRHTAELKEMQTSYDQLLADHHRLINDKIELERARDRAIESHKATTYEAKGMLTRYGVTWVVKLVHQSPELEKVVADLVNSVNVVCVNEGIKQGFKAAHDSVRSAEEVSGYDEGAQDVLNDAIKAFDNFHISALGKVADLVD